MWDTKMYIQYMLAVFMIFLIIGLQVFVKKRIQSCAIGLFMNESKKQSVIGALAVNIFLVAYAFLWFYFLYDPK